MNLDKVEFYSSKVLEERTRNYLQKPPVEYMIGDPIVDQHFRIREASFNLLLGHPSSGKTFLASWALFKLAMRYPNLKFGIFTGENKASQFYSGQLGFKMECNPLDATEEQKEDALKTLSGKFTFVKDNGSYGTTELLEKMRDLAKLKMVDIILIDPALSLINDMNTDNYNYTLIFSNLLRGICEETGVAIILSTHATANAQRNIHPKGHQFAGHVTMPLGSDATGGVWRNFADDLWIVHRYYDADEYSRKRTYMKVDKIKYSDTGCKETAKAAPLVFTFNNYTFTPGYDEAQQEGFNQADVIKNYEKDTPF